MTDGTLRDTPEIAKLDLPVYAQGASPLTNLAQHHAVDINVPIGCAEVAIYPGDIMVGDARGRRVRARSTWRRRSPRRRYEQERARGVDRSTRSPAASRSAAPIRPTETTLERYHQHRTSG